jgi:hypothetical protein
MKRSFLLSTPCIRAISLPFRFLMGLLWRGRSMMLVIKITPPEYAPSTPPSPLYLPMSKRQRSPPPRVRRQITRPSLCSNMKSAKSCVLPMPTSYQLPENIARLWYNLCYGDFCHRSKRPATKWGISFSHPKNG